MDVQVGNVPVEGEMKEIEEPLEEAKDNRLIPQPAEIENLNDLDRPTTPQIEEPLDDISEPPEYI